MSEFPVQKNLYVLPASIIVAGIIIAGAVLYRPGSAPSGSVGEATVAEQVAEVKKIDYVELAATIGLDTKAFKTCIDSRTFKNEVEKDQADGSKAGVDGTPTTFINGTKVEGAVPYENYKKAIDDALAVPINAKILPSAPGTDKDDDAILGDPKARVAVVIYGDYQCPYCQRAYQTGEAQVRKEYVETGKAYMVFRDFPLNFHAAAVPAAEASECAHAQGKFWEYHDALFDNQDRLPIP